MPLSAAILPEMLEKLRFFPYSRNLAGEEYTCDFASYLADCLKEVKVITSEELLLKVELMFKRLSRGLDDDGRPIRHRAADRVPTAELFVRMDLPLVFAYIFPPEFITDVERVREEVLTEMMSRK
jgi:hypothetical protein